MVRVARKELKVEYGEGHLRLSSRIRKGPPHAAFDDRRDNTVQARITIEQPTQGRPVCHCTVRSTWPFVLDVLPGMTPASSYSR
jgi:hypothetical protein